MARRSCGGVAMMLMSRTPDMDMCSVRGMGVAVSVSTSTWVRSCLSCSFCFTPKRCSSSTMSSPRSLKATSPASSLCVPMRMSTLPSWERLSTSRTSGAFFMPEMTSTVTG